METDADSAPSRARLTGMSSRETLIDLHLPQAYCIPCVRQTAFAAGPVSVSSPQGARPSPLPQSPLLVFALPTMTISVDGLHVHAPYFPFLVCPCLSRDTEGTRSRGCHKASLCPGG